MNNFFVWLTGTLIGTLIGVVLVRLVTTYLLCRGTA